jgi:hypothetical protein
MGMGPNHMVKSATEPSAKGSTSLKDTNNGGGVSILSARVSEWKSATAASGAWTLKRWLYCFIG